MKLAGIWVVWNDFDLLEYSIKAIGQLVDGIIIVGSTHSNFGEYSAIPDEFKTDELCVHEPKFNIPMHSETDKRNFGLDIARQKGYTHFVMLDADEMYDKHQFRAAKERFLNEPNLQGLVCPCNVYFKSPTLTIGRDITLVPFIHKITPTLKFEFNRRYPFAWIDGQIRIDPTRSMNITDGVAFTEDIVMEHFSWVRKDIEKKVRNSSARANIERSTLREDYANAKAGYYCKYYKAVLKECPDTFGLLNNL